MLERDQERSDQELLAQYQLGDAKAMDCLVDRHGPTVYSYVRRFLGGGHTVDDLTQEVWLRVLRNSQSFDGRSRFTTWLFAVTRNTCIDHIRRRKRQKKGPSDAGGEAFHLDELSDPGPSVVERLAQKELTELVEAGLAGLSETQREVFLLREQTDLSFREIGEVLEIPSDTVKSRMRYALGHLRRFVRRSKSDRKVKARGL